VAPLAAESTFDPAPVPWLRALTESMALLLTVPTFDLVVDDWTLVLASNMTSFITSEA
jgi:hypothetical protein